jgi:hypothetical protein
MIEVLSFGQELNSERRAMARFGTGTRVLFMLFALPLGAGCGPGSVPVGEVAGVVTKNGKPLAKITVQFLPDPEKGTFGPIAAGSTDENGHYQLTCIDERPGAVVGWNRVVLNDNLPRLQRPLRISREDEEAADNERKPVKGGARADPSSRVPDKYTASGRTPLIVEVKPEKQEFNFELSR